MTGEMSQSEVTRENFPALFDLQDALLEAGVSSEARAFDQYAGPYLYVPGVGKVWYDDETPDAFTIMRGNWGLQTFETRGADWKFKATKTTLAYGSYLIDSAVNRIVAILKKGRAE